MRPSEVVARVKGDDSTEKLESVSDNEVSGRDSWRRCPCHELAVWHPVIAGRAVEHFKALVVRVKSNHEPHHSPRFFPRFDDALTERAQECENRSINPCAWERWDASLTGSNGAEHFFQCTNVTGNGRFNGQVLFIQYCTLYCTQSPRSTAEPWFCISLPSVLQNVTGMSSQAL
jgi:hypothetical protein